MSLNADKKSLVFGSGAGSMNRRAQCTGRSREDVSWEASQRLRAAPGSRRVTPPRTATRSRRRRTHRHRASSSGSTRVRRTRRCVAPAKTSGNAGATIALDARIPEPHVQPAAVDAPSAGRRLALVRAREGQRGERHGTRARVREQRERERDEHVRVRHRERELRGRLARHGVPSELGDATARCSCRSRKARRWCRRSRAYTIAAGGATLDMATRQNVISVNQPFDNHNGGNIAFGPNDGYLYAGFGDGGDGGDPLQHRARHDGSARLVLAARRERRGAIRDSAGQSVREPAPCARADHRRVANNCPEIYAWGFRNPWRWSFDRANGDLWVGDVGQGAFEEIDRVARGGNYGWDCREGAGAFSGSAIRRCAARCRARASRIPCISTAGASAFR